MTWYPVLVVLAGLGGGLYAWWDTSLFRITVWSIGRRAELMFTSMQTPEAKAAHRRAMQLMTQILTDSGRAALDARRAANDVCGMKCPGGSERRQCGCVGPRDCVLNRGGER